MSTDYSYAVDTISTDIGPRNLDSSNTDVYM